jgi:hypothetical protein
MIAPAQCRECRVNPYAIRHINELLHSPLSGNGNGCVGESGESAFGVYPRDL